MAQDDVDRLRAGYEAFNSGDWAQFLETLHPDFVISDRDELPDPQTHVGREGAKDAMVRASEGFDGYRIEPEEYIDLGDTIVVVATQRGRGEASGAEVEGTIVHLWRVRDGLATSMRAFSSREQALEAAGHADDGD
jgi:uncharacterized protein